MTKTNCLVLFLFILLIVSGCSGKKNADSTQLENTESTGEFENDSIELTDLVRKVYEWHMTVRLNDFPYKYEEPGDTLFVGIDWDKYNNTSQVLKQTDFFSQEFLDNHKKIALTVDSSIKKADKEWRNIKDGIPIWDTDADDWCGCQDYADNYWEKLTLYDITISNDVASFYWAWNDQRISGTFAYKMTAKKENNKWRISSMQGFDYKYTVEHYDKFMND